MKRSVKIAILAIGFTLLTGVLVFSLFGLNKLRSVSTAKSSTSTASQATFPASLDAIGVLSGGGQNNSQAKCDKCMDDCMKEVGNNLSYVADCAGTCGAECGHPQGGGNKNTKKYKYKLKK